MTLKQQPKHLLDKSWRVLFPGMNWKEKKMRQPNPGSGPYLPIEQKMEGRSSLPLFSKLLDIRQFLSLALHVSVGFSVKLTIYRERERDRQTDRQTERARRAIYIYIYIYIACVCVCVCERERERVIYIYI